MIRVSSMINFQQAWDIVTSLNLTPYQQQSFREMNILWNIIQKLNPKNIIEIGVAKGGSNKLLELAAPNARMFLIDILDSSAKLEKKLRSNVDYLFYDSHKKETIDSIKKVLNGDNVDFLYIDGDHTYEGAKQDYEVFGELVQYGIIAFHDIVSCPIGAGKVWNEISRPTNIDTINTWREFSTMEIVFPREENKTTTPQLLGTGILFKNCDIYKWLQQT